MGVTGLDSLLVSLYILKPTQFNVTLTLLHSERPKLYGVLAVLSAVGLSRIQVVLKHQTGW